MVSERDFVPSLVHPPRGLRRGRCCRAARAPAPDAGLQLDEDHGSICKLPADDPLRGEAKAVALEAQGSFQIIAPDGDDGDAWLHRLVLLHAEHPHGATQAVSGVPMGNGRGPSAFAPVIVFGGSARIYSGISASTSCASSVSDSCQPR